MDVFISYSHRDNEPDPVLETRWVSDLHRAIEHRLGQILGRDAVVWRDPRMKGNEPVGVALDRRLEKATALVCVITPSFIGSSWCRRELESFGEVCQRQEMESIEGRSRIFKVLKTPVDLEQHPPGVRELLGYEFYTQDPETGYPQELQKAFGKEVQVQYWQRLNRLAYEIAELLQTVEQTEASRSRPTIFLAETGEDLRTERETVHTDLIRKGYRVLPERSLPASRADLDTALAAQLRASDLSVHLVGENRGRLTSAADLSLIEAQLRAASRHAESGRILWLPAGLSPADPEQAELVKRLREGSDLGPADDLVEGSLDKLQLTIDRATSAPVSPAPSEPAAAEPGLRVYLIHDTLDAETVSPVADTLFSSGYEVITPAFEGVEADIRADDQENLKTCDAVMLYWGAGSELWRRRRQRDVLKSWGYGRTRPLVSTAIYVAPPDRPEKRRFRTHDALILSALDSTDEDLLEPFFEQLRSQPGAQTR